MPKALKAPAIAIIVPHQKYLSFLTNKFLQPSPLLFLPYPYTIPHRALAPISGNIPYYKELSSYNRGVIISYTSSRAIVP